MYYYLVWVRSSRFHGSEPLTYASDQRLPTGQIVEVELQKEVVLGFISGTTSEPRFKTKPLARTYDLPPLPNTLIKLARWLQHYYPAPLGIVSQQVLPATFSKNSLGAIASEPLAALQTEQLPQLTAEQQAAFEQMQDITSYVLHGATGSGKTRLYIELALKTVRAGSSVVVLTPEISLTTQLASTMKAVFGNRVVVVHSQQTPNERQLAWLRCLTSTEPLVIIGPRSALWSPLQKLGCIIIDESHETAYKQDQAPHYQTTRVAAYLAGLSRASLVLGSATPSIGDYYVAQQKMKPIIEMRELAMGSERSFDSAQDENLDRSTRDGKVPLGDAKDSKVIIVDRKEHAEFSRSPYLSLPLIKAMEQALARKEQSLLYLNRRGTARLVMCENCGWQASCPHCDIPLTYHGDRHELRCHTCDYRGSAPINCPECGHAGIMYKTAGTKAISQEVERLFPNARVARFDTDNAKAERFEQQYQAVHDGNVDILVGTQLLAKGLDLPRLSTLGIVLAETSLYVADYTAQERTYQLITQVLGRINRGHVAGTAIIQTYHPDHPVLAKAIANDYRGFYEQELAERKQFLFPPFCYLLKLSVRRASSKTAEKAAEQLLHDITHTGLKVRVEGPAPSVYEKVQGKYQWQLIVKALDRGELLTIIANLPANWSYDIDPSDLL